MLFGPTANETQVCLSDRDNVMTVCCEAMLPWDSSEPVVACCRASPRALRRADDVYPGRSYTETQLQFSSYRSEPRTVAFVRSDHKARAARYRLCKFIALPGTSISRCERQRPRLYRHLPHHQHHGVADNARTALKNTSSWQGKADGSDVNALALYLHRPAAAMRCYIGLEGCAGIRRTACSFTLLPVRPSNCSSI